MKTAKRIIPSTQKTQTQTPETAPTQPAQLTLLERVRQQSKAKFWNPEKENDAIEGEIVKIAHGIGRYNSSHYYLQTADGIQIVSAGETTVLGGKLRGEHLEVGDRLAVVFLGEKEGENGRTYKNWQVGSEKPVRPKADNGPPPTDDENIPF